MIRKTISMPDKMGEWITARVKDGQYGNESEYIRDLVRNDQQRRDYENYLRQSLLEGEADIAAGRYTVMETKEEVKSLFRQVKAGKSQ